MGDWGCWFVGFVGFVCWRIGVSYLPTTIGAQWALCHLLTSQFSQLDLRPAGLPQGWAEKQHEPSASWVLWEGSPDRREINPGESMEKMSKRKLTQTRDEGGEGLNWRADRVPLAYGELQALAWRPM